MDTIYKGLSDFLVLSELVLSVFKITFKASKLKEIINLSPIEITGSLMKTILMKIFIINFPQSNHKIMFLLEKYFYQF